MHFLTLFQTVLGHLCGAREVADHLERARPAVPLRAGRHAARRRQAREGLQLRTRRQRKLRSCEGDFVALKITAVEKRSMKKHF